MANPVRYNGFPRGIDNRRSNFDVATGALRDGVNVDILPSGRVRMRPGIVQLIADPDAHSVFSDGERIVWATKSALKVATSSLVPTTLLTDVRLASPLSWAPLHGELYFSNEAINGLVNVNSAYEPWGVAPPATAPLLAAVAGERFVQVTCVFLISRRALDGSTVLEESGAPLGAVVACGDAPVISVTSIPQSPDPRFVATRLYVTELDGTVFYSQVELPAGVTSYALAGPFGKGQVLKTQFMQPPPPGQLLEVHNGRIWIAAGPNVFRTQPLRYGLYDPEEDYLMYPRRVVLLKRVDDGMYVSADGTYFESGIGTPDLDHKPIHPYRAIEGAACNIPDSKDVMWLSTRGFVRGSAGGVVKNLTDGQVAMAAYTRACIGVVEKDGVKSVVAITQGGPANPLVHKDYLAAQITRTAELE